MLNRRKFIKRATAISSVALLTPKIVFTSTPKSSVRLGIVGVGRRGLGVVRSMSENAKVNITAAADLLVDKLSVGVKELNSLNRQIGFSEIRETNKFVGSKSYLNLIRSKDIDAVLISTPAYAHPEILEAAVAAGKHVYCEKPAAIDIDGCKRIQTVSKNMNNNLSAVIGFQIRYATPYVEMVRRIHRGDIGEIVSVQLYYFSSNVPLVPIDGISYDEARIRNHFHFNELSGGILLDQGIHMIDVCNWALKTKPLYAIGVGGKKGCLEFGNTWTNYQVIYKYPNDVNVSVQSTQVGPSFGDVCARFVGTSGIAEAHYSGGVFIKGKNEWDSGVVKSESALTPEGIAANKTLSSLDDADLNKGTSFIKSIESGQYINQLQSGCDSTISAILGREAATRQELVRWDEIDMSSARIDPKLDLKQFDKQ